jgi:hypothetical protein
VHNTSLYNLYGAALVIYFKFSYITVLETYLHCFQIVPPADLHQSVVVRLLQIFRNKINRRPLSLGLLFAARNLCGSGALFLWEGFLSAFPYDG